MLESGAVMVQEVANYRRVLGEVRNEDEGNGGGVRFLRRLPLNGQRFQSIVTKRGNGEYTVITQIDHV